MAAFLFLFSALALVPARSRSRAAQERASLDTAVAGFVEVARFETLAAAQRAEMSLDAAGVAYRVLGGHTATTLAFLPDTNFRIVVRPEHLEAAHAVLALEPAVDDPENG